MREVSFVREQECNSTPDEAWSIISDWKRTTEFWKGTREMTKIDNNTFRVRFAFPGTALMKLILDESEKSVTEEYLRGPFRGTKKTSVTGGNGNSMLKTEWNVTLSPLLALGRKSIQAHFSEGTKNALKRISDTLGVHA